MKIAHMALWTQDLEQQARFWVSFFDGKINEKYCSKTVSVKSLPPVIPVPGSLA